MLRIRFLTLLTVFCCLTTVAAPAIAAEVEGSSVYCFTPEDFAREEGLSGICITGLPEESLGTVSLGDRVLRPGDILSAEQLARMTFVPLVTEGNLSASVTYLPILEGHAAPAVTMTISILGRENLAPAAEDSAYETYKNLPLEGKLKVREPEEQAMTFQLVRKPRRGDVEIREDGSFTYTPRKNKVGTDSFTYTATDEKGNVSREARVTVQILKPTDATQYTDTLGRECRFAAEWMKNTGIFVGETLGGSACFGPDKEVSRGEFLTMLVKALDIPAEEAPALAEPEGDVPGWLKPYLAAALRSGLTAGLPREADDYRAPVTGAEAAVMLHNALDLAPVEETGASGEAKAMPAWAADALEVMASHGFLLSPADVLTREQAALCLYRASSLASQAPGITALRAVWDTVS